MASPTGSPCPSRSRESLRARYCQAATPGSIQKRTPAWPQRRAGSSNRNGQNPRWDLGAAPLGPCPLGERTKAFRVRHVGYPSRGFRRRTGHRIRSRLGCSGTPPEPSTLAANPRPRLVQGLTYIPQKDAAPPTPSRTVSISLAMHGGVQAGLPDWLRTPPENGPGSGLRGWSIPARGFRHRYPRTPG